MIAACAMALTVAACDFPGLPTFDIGSQVNLNTEYGVIAGYGIVVNAENAYKALPLCLTGTKPRITNICARRSIIVSLQKTDRIANNALNQMSLFIKNNPSV